MLRRAIVVVTLILILSTFICLNADDSSNPAQKPNMAERVANTLHEKYGIPSWIVVILISTTPIFELRGAIPVGIGMNMQWWWVFILAVFGNMIPVIPLLLWLEPVSKFLSRHPWGDKFFKWLFARTRRKGEMIERYEFWGIAIFVGIPLPATGAWSGCAAAFIFGVPFRRALPAVFMGVLMAATVVTLAVTGLFKLGSIFI